MHARDSISTPALPQITRRQDYQPPTHRIASVRLDFTLDLHATRVIAEYRVEQVGDSAELLLAGDELQLISVAVDGQTLPADAFDHSPQQLRLHALPRTCHLRIETLLDPTANTALMGLYASRGGLFTQCESEGFRRITYFLDRPDVMATYDVVMRGSRAQFPVMLSNGNLLAERDLGGGVHECHWQDPFPKPSYLFALVAAQLDRIEDTITTASGRKALLQVHTRAEDIAQAGFAMASLKRAIFWDERRYGLELDLERFMIVAVPDFNSGAMENKGLNLFNTKFVLADPDTATDIDYDGIESVVAHEYFHNWTGNRITCRDWFQLTLKEGLTVFRDSEFSSDMAAEGLSPTEAASARAVRRIDSVRVLRAAQFPEDAGPMSHPIRPDSYQEIRNFYTATVYEKGAEVIRMLQTLLGVDGFRRGMDLYFARHDGQAVTCEDFVNAMFDANGRAGAPHFMRWYDTSGTPEVHVREHWDADARRYSLAFSQSISARSPSRLPLTIPLALGLIGPDGRDIPLDHATVSGEARLEQGMLIMQGESAELYLGASHRPVPSLLRDFSAPVALRFEQDTTQLLHLLAHDSDAFNRWEAGQRLMLAAMLAPASVSLDDMLAAFRAIAADTALDNGYKAAILTPPSELYIAEQVAVIDPAVIRAARNGLRLAMAHALREELAQIHHQLHSRPGQAYSPDPISTGRRSLANLARHWLALSGEISGAQLLAGMRAADNMTDRMAALQALVESEAPEAAQALADYHARFAGHALAMDKWFSVQASMLDASALVRVRDLLAHPLYDAGNPNRVRALLGVFFHQNLPGFHRADGEAYGLWAEQVLAIDRRNSQLASRMARALDRWSRFEPARRSAMQAALERVAADGQLSPDVREVVGKSLASA